MNLLTDLSVDLVLDVGANDGAFARELRADGYRGRIASFEPSSAAFARLRDASAGDPEWHCEQVALGAESGTASINVAQNSSSSSLLPMTTLHRLSAPDAAYVDVEPVRVVTLDAAKARLGSTSTSIFLKVDVQGYEAEVFKGGPEVLASASLVECELSFSPLYVGQELFSDIVEVLRASAFVLHGIEPVHADVRTGELLQINGLFVRSDVSRCFSHD